MLKTLLVYTFLSVVSGAMIASQAEGATVRFHRLKCNETADFFADHVYLEANDETIWGPVRINDGNSRSLSRIRPIAFTDSLTVELMEQDLADPDDSLGSAIITADLAGKGLQTRYFSGDGGSYTLTFEVLP